MQHVYRKAVLVLVAAGITLSRSTFAQMPRYTPPRGEPRAPKARQVQIIQGPELELFRNNEAIIRWTSTNPGGTDEHWAVVRYGTAPNHLDETAKSHIRLNRGHSSTIFRVRLENVRLGTTYYYTVSSINGDGTEDSVKSGVYHFAAPTVDPGRIVVGTATPKKQ